MLKRENQKRNKALNMKKRKIRSEEKVLGLAQSSYPHKEMGDSHPGWNHKTRGMYHLMWRRTQGAGIIKGWEDKRDGGYIPDTFT